MDLLSLALLGGLLALDGTSFGQFMVSRPLMAGVITGWVVGDPIQGLLIGGILEVYFISTFPVGGAEFPEGGPPTLVATAIGVSVSGAAGVALGVLFGLLLSRLGSLLSRILRKINGRLVPDPSRQEVTPGRIVAGHLCALSLDFARGCLLTLVGLGLGSAVAFLAADSWPLGMPGTLTLLAVGASIPAGAFVGSLGGWRRRWVLLASGVTTFLLLSLVL